MEIIGTKQIPGTHEINAIECAQVDGLSHGPSAAKDSRAATAVSCKKWYKPRDVLQNRIHAGRLGARGAVGAAPAIDIRSRRPQSGGIGNSQALYATPLVRHRLASHHGTPSKQIREAQDLENDWKSRSQALTRADGHSQRWSLPSALVHKSQRIMDDCAVLAPRKNRP